MAGGGFAPTPASPFCLAGRERLAHGPRGGRGKGGGRCPPRGQSEGEPAALNRAHAQPRTFPGGPPVHARARKRVATVGVHGGVSENRCTGGSTGAASPRLTRKKRKAPRARAHARQCTLGRAQHPATASDAPALLCAGCHRSIGGRCKRGRAHRTVCQKADKRGPLSSRRVRAARACAHVPWGAHTAHRPCSWLGRHPCLPGHPRGARC